MRTDYSNVVVEPFSELTTITFLQNRKRVPQRVPILHELEHAQSI